MTRNEAALLLGDLHHGLEVAEGRFAKAGLREIASDIYAARLRISEAYRASKELPKKASVYLVTRCYTEPERIICGVFSSREKADEYITKASAGDPWPSWEVNAHEVDSTPTGSGGGT